MSQQEAGEVAGLESINCLPCTWLLFPITSSNLTLLIKSTLTFYPLHSILTPLFLRHCPVHPITFERSWEQGSAPALTCLDTTGPLFCPHGGEEEDGGVWLERWGGYACRLKVRVGGLAMSVRERKQRKPEVTLLTLNVLKPGKLTFIQNNDGQRFRNRMCLFSGF